MNNKQPKKKIDTSMIYYCSRSCKHCHKAVYGKSHISRTQAKKDLQIELKKHDKEFHLIENVIL